MFSSQGTGNERVRFAYYKEQSDDSYGGRLVWEMGESGGREGGDVWPEMLRVWTGPVAVAMATDSTEIHKPAKPT